MIAQTNNPSALTAWNTLQQTSHNYKHMVTTGDHITHVNGLSVVRQGQIKDIRLAENK